MKILPYLKAFWNHVNLQLKRTFQQYQYEKFPLIGRINDLTCFNENILSPSCLFNSYGDHVIYYKLEMNNLSIPEVAASIKNCMISGFTKELLHGFAMNGAAKWTVKTCLKIFVTTSSRKALLTSRYYQSLRKTNKKKQYCSVNTVCFSLLVTYTSIKAYRVL